MPFPRVKVWVANEVLKSTDLNTEFDNVSNNFTTSGLGGISSNVSNMQAAVDPGGLGTESLATTLTGELQRIRYALRRLVDRSGAKQWYEAPVKLTGTDIADNSLSLSNFADNFWAATSAARAKFASGFLTSSMLPAPNYAVSSGSGTWSTSSTTPQPINNLIATFTTIGRPVEIRMNPTNYPSATGITMSFSGSSTTDQSLGSYFLLYRDGTAIARSGVQRRARFDGSTVVPLLSTSDPLSVISFIDFPSAASHTYQLYAYVDNNTTVFIANAQLYVKEING